MCGSLDDCDPFSDLLSGSDDGFDLSAGVLGSPPNSPPTRNTLQNELESQPGPATYDEIYDYMLSTNDDDIDGCSQIGCEWNCGPAISESRSSATDGPATVALGQDTTPHTSVQRIEALVVDFLEQLSAALPSTEEEVKDVLRRKLKNPRKLELKLMDRKKLCDDGAFGTRTQSFPKGVHASITPFAQLFRIADLAHEAIEDDLPVTKRSLFYRDVQLFKRQSVVDKVVDDLAATIDTTRAQLNIRASPKGLICGGGLSIRTVGGDVIHVTESEGTLIPVPEDIASFDFSNKIDWVLVVEKEAVFQTLRQLCFVRHPFSHRGTGVMITGKGYPDLATRQMVKTLSDNLPSTYVVPSFFSSATIFSRVPFVTLVDGDAYGLDIASVYKFGSVALRHESYRLAVPRIECIGVWASELASLGIDKCALLPISRADEKKARSMLRRELPDRWKKELVHMLYTRRKAETEILSSVSCIPGQPHPLARYLADKISEQILALAWQPASGTSTEDDVDGSLFDEL
ncbi:Spo11/DNA topoisomerase VI subunit A [Lactarius sanguifluus]|nr:Spo11/DNA topoisomerase VI subunit A [Lactarius sanguifluus]